jgi:hypothetical protein
LKEVFKNILYDAFFGQYAITKDRTPGFMIWSEAPAETFIGGPRRFAATRTSEARPLPSPNKPYNDNFRIWMDPAEVQ